MNHLNSTESYLEQPHVIQLLHFPHTIVSVSDCGLADKQKRGLETNENNAYRGGKGGPRNSMIAGVYFQRATRFTDCQAVTSRRDVTQSGMAAAGTRRQCCQNACRDQKQRVSWEMTTAFAARGKRRSDS
ncbi:hypothetical protein CEXT_378941 [Caerostris extrusa]|uniref:Uncharacterized protein n=1 Tax=Caerostris extrusa TaxID=172846 RepID=A0AAV4P2L3_CAEEX|nr:hypothetical protein CEXT_378941 [Caerostris extrusa]